MENGNELSQLLPGQPLRVGVDLIADKNSGALIVIGTSNKLEKISSGGINLIDCLYSPEMLSELSKMDGAIIVSDDVTKILKANVHLNPSDTLLTSQTGTRHRTAERTAEETNLTVLTVSEESSLVKVFTNAGTTELEEPSVTLGRVNESLQSVDRMRRRFDDAVAELGELEIENSLTNQEFIIHGFLLMIWFLLINYHSSYYYLFYYYFLLKMHLGEGLNIILPHEVVLKKNRKLIYMDLKLL